jgi:hypothetical protein
LDQVGELWGAPRVVAVDAKHQEPSRTDVGRQLGQRLERRCAAQVQVVQHQQNGAVGARAGECLCEGLQRILGGGCRAPVQDPAALVVDLAGELGGQPGLPDPPPAGHEHCPALAPSRAGPGGSKPGQLDDPADEGRPGGLERVGQLAGRMRLGRRGRSQPGVLGEDCRVQPAELRPRVDAQLLDQDRPGPLVGQQRIRLPARAVHGQHELGPHPLAQWVVPDQPIQLGHQLPVASQLQVDLDTVLQGDQPQLGQPAGLGRAEVAIEEFLEGLTPPEPQSLPQHRCCRHRLSLGADAAGPGDELLEPGRVQRPGRDPQQVAGLPGDQNLRGGAAAAPWLQGPPNPHDV